MLREPSISLLGVGIDPMTIDEILHALGEAIAERERLVVTSQNMHSLYLHPRSSAIRELQEQSLRRVDGMPLILMARALGHPTRRDQRVTWVDLMGPLMDRAAERGWNIFYLGADQDSLERGLEALRSTRPGLSLIGRNGYFDVADDGEENRAVLDEIRVASPDVLIVGMGMPRQERWILANQSALDVPVIMTSGAAIQYVAGSIRTPPRWMGRLGLEWLARLADDPKRLAHRYLVEPWPIAVRFARDLARRPRRRSAVR